LSRPIGASRGQHKDFTLSPSLASPYNARFGSTFGLKESLNRTIRSLHDHPESDISSAAPRPSSQARLNRTTNCKTIQLFVQSLSSSTRFRTSSTLALRRPETRG
jgi:hypothetical protein